MTATTLTPPSQTAVATAVDGIATARFIDLVTFRRTGEPVGTPVLLVPDADGQRLLVRTARDSGKLKRLGHTSAVEVTPCDSRGRHLGPTTTGHARVLDDAMVAPTLARLHARYRIAGPLFSAIRRLRHQDDVIVEIVLDGQPAIDRRSIGERAIAAGIRYAPAAASTIVSADPGEARRVARDIVAMSAMPTCLSLVLGLAIVVAACGGSPVSAPTTAPGNDTPVAETTATASTAAGPSAATGTTTTSTAGPCALLPADLAAAVLGEPVGEGIAKTSATFGNASCRYTATGSPASVALWLHPSTDRDEWDASMAKLGLTPEMTLPEIGEAAYRYDGRTTHRTKIAVFDAGHDFYLEIVDAADPDGAALTAVGLARDLVVALR